MRFLKQFTPQKRDIEIVIALLKGNYQEDVLIVDSLDDKTIAAYQQFIIGFTIEQSEIKMIVCYNSDYVNQLNFRLTSHYFIVSDENIYPLSLFQYPDGTISESLFNDTHNYLNQFFNETNE